MIYLATPYSHADPAIREERFLAVNKVAARLMQAGHLVFSPISHGHPIQAAGDLPTDWGYWQRYCEKMLSVCTSLVIVKLDGWKESVGVAAEFELAKKFGLLTVFIDPASSTLETSLDYEAHLHLRAFSKI